MPASAWLQRQHGMDEYLESQSRWSGKRGAEIGVEKAEAFRQYRGHPYPQDNLLLKLIGQDGRGRPWRPRPRREPPGSGSGIINQLGDRASQVAAVHDPIDEAMLQEEFTGLKTLGQLDAHRLFDDSGAGKPDQGLGFSDNDVTERGEAGSNPAHGRMSEYADEQAAVLAVTPQSSGDLRHLHQREDSFMHSRPAPRSRDDHQRKSLPGGGLDGPRQLFSDNRTHRTHDEVTVGDAEDDANSLDESLSDQGGLVQASPFLLRLESLRIGTPIVKFERVGWLKSENQSS